MKTPQRKVVIPAGTTWVDAALWLTTPFRFFDASAVTRGWPTTITVTGHGMPIGSISPVYLANTGRLRIDTVGATPHFAEAVDADTLSFPALNTLDRPDEPQKTPRIALYTPRDLTGCSASIQFRSSVDGAVLVALTSASGITLSGSTISVSLTPTQTKALLRGGTTQTSGAAQLELTTAASETYRLWQYDWTCTPEWTREA